MTRCYKCQGKGVLIDDPEYEPYHEYECPNCGGCGEIEE